MLIAKTQVRVRNQKFTDASSVATGACGRAQSSVADDYCDDGGDMRRATVYGDRRRVLS
jgi:hypothetical protein